MAASRNTTVHKKPIEVALPLDAINKASVKEVSIRHEHPSTLPKKRITALSTNQLFTRDICSRLKGIECLQAEDVASGAS